MLTSAILPISIFVLLFMIFVPFLLRFSGHLNFGTVKRLRMKLVMDFYKQMQIEGNKRGKSEKAACRPPLPERNQGKEHFNELRQEGTQEENHKVKQVLEETAEKKPSQPPISSEKKLEDWQATGFVYCGWISFWIEPYYFYELNTCCIL